MEVSLKFKVGDKFILPNNEWYPGVHTITKIDRDGELVRYWAILKGHTLYSEEEYMRRPTKLELALK